MPSTFYKSLFVLFAALLLLSLSPRVGALAEDVQAPAGLAAPWPAGITLHGGGDGYGYEGQTHTDTDKYAMDFNGYPDASKENPPVESADGDLLVLAISDGCVKNVAYNPGGPTKDPVTGEEKWSGNYGWNIVISHPGGYESRYAHLKEKPLIAKGDYDPKKCEIPVTQGQPLGQIGGTGTENNDSVHLHLALYYCQKDKEQDPCKTVAVKPEPLDGVEDLPKIGKAQVRVKSGNYSVGYEEIKGNALTDPDYLRLHKPIWQEYRSWGGQFGFFGRAQGPVLQIPGTNIYYQEFKPQTEQSSYGSAIVEIDSRAYMLPEPIWKLYKSNPAKYGNPNATTYVSEIGSQSSDQAGWRTDFQNASLFWNWKLSEPVIWDEKTAPWKVLFCPGKDNFSCNPVRRRDLAIDFFFSDSNNPGPLEKVEGFSALWQASIQQNLVSKIRLNYQIQGNARFYIDDRVQGDWIRSEDAVASGITSPTWHVGGNTFVIRFWQSAGKPARLTLTVNERGLVSSVFAFESGGKCWCT
jgi:murein DD-endopeptidase MepM/ murein hydrolase activator NlpD